MDTTKENRELKGYYIPHALAIETSLSWNEKIVYSVYHFFTFNGELKCCTLTTETLATRLGLSVRTIKNIKNSLKKKEYIKTDGGIKTTALKFFEWCKSCTVESANLAPMECKSCTVESANLAPMECKSCTVESANLAPKIKKEKKKNKEVIKNTCNDNVIVTTDDDDLSFINVESVEAAPFQHFNGANSENYQLRYEQAKHTLKTAIYGDGWNPSNPFNENDNEEQEKQARIQRRQDNAEQLKKNFFQLFGENGRRVPTTEELTEIFNRLQTEELSDTDCSKLKRMFNDTLQGMNLTAPMTANAA